MSFDTAQGHPSHSPFTRATGDSMKLLLTSGGVTNASIHSALVRLLGKPVTESRALCVPTAQWGHPMCDPTSVQGFTAAGSSWQQSSGLGWASLGVLELTALPTIGNKRWVPWVQEADVLLVDGGDATYLCHWMRESGLADLLPSLPDKVWVGVSAGSMVMTPRIGQYFVEWPAAPNDRTLGVVDFSIFPHLEAFPTNTMAHAERWAATIDVPAYAIDEQTAITVVNGYLEVVSEGHWTKFEPQPTDTRRTGPVHS
jgi:dipeptidase E